MFSNLFNLPEIYSIFKNCSSSSICVMQEFHDLTMLFLTIIVSFIMTIIIRIFYSKTFFYNFMENMNLEMIWTTVPMIILFLIAYPSLFYLYLFDLSINPSVTVKVFGAQWYWIYENFDMNSGYSNSSYMLNDLEILESKNYKMGWRLLETDTRLVIPYNSEVQCITTSMDVIHSFSIPELGIKIDAVPGRLNSVVFQVSKPGLFYGQCAEICGTGHPFMPICVEAI